MKLSQLFNLPLQMLGLKLVRLSTLRKMQEASAVPTADIRRDKGFMYFFEQVNAYSMTGMERIYALYQSLRFIHENKIPGDLVECGVWRGGSCMLMALYLKSVGETSRKIYLYDTFEGMVAPGRHDGELEKQEWQRLQIGSDRSDWCRSPLEEVQRNMQTTGYPTEKLIFVKGKVEETIPRTLPGSIALLRLDTDWYESTHHELTHLFPLLVDRGVLLIDDYGAWQGAKKAVDDYFSNKPFLLNRIDNSGRLMLNV